MVILGHLPHKRGMAGGRAIKFRFIQALRGIAAALVVLYHAAEGGHIPALMAVLPAPAAALFHHGWIGVPIFFALSGFVIAYSVSGQAIGWGFFGRFILRRSVRLDPPYWVSIGLVVAIGALSAWVKAEAFDLPTPGQLLSHITYTQVLLGYPPINDVYWTLTYEVQFLPCPRPCLAGPATDGAEHGAACIGRYHFRRPADHGALECRGDGKIICPRPFH